jgi:DNA-binding IclR family transcriptional regulator
MADTVGSAPRSVSRIFALLELMARQQRSMTLAEISSELALPKSSLLGLLRPLVSEDYLSHRDGRYSLGSSLFHLSAAILELRQFPQIARQYLTDLAETSGESVVLAAVDLQAETVMYVDTIESKQAVRYAAPTGSIRPLYCSAAGVCLLSFQAPEWREAFLERVSIKPLTEFTVRDVNALRKRCDRIRQLGVATSLREAVVEAAGLAAPIFGINGQVEHAVLIGLPAERFGQREKELTELVKETAARITYCLGGANAIAQSANSSAEAPARRTRRRTREKA